MVLKFLIDMILLYHKITDDATLRLRRDPCRDST